MYYSMNMGKKTRYLHQFGLKRNEKMGLNGRKVFFKTTKKPTDEALFVRLDGERRDII